MKRNKNALFQKLVSFENLLIASKKAVLGKKPKLDLLSFISNREEELLQLQSSLIDHTWTPSPFHSFQIFEPKPRLISSTCFKDRIVHHALCQIIEKDLERISIFDSYACRPHKGLHKALQKLQVYSKSWQFYLKIDIEHFFETADHDILFSQLQRLFKDKELLMLMKKIIDHGAPGSQSGKGLPIGNLTSQFWSNFYLGHLDLFIKHQLRVKGYIRYMDDMVLFADSIEDLQRYLCCIQGFVEQKLKLKLKEKATILSAVSHGIPYLGFRVWPNQIRLDSARKRRLLRRLKGIHSQLKAGYLISHTVKMGEKLETLLAWAHVAQTYGLIKSWGGRHRWHDD